MSEASATNQQAADGRADFDFFVGTWHVRNRRLQRGLAESAEWEEFPATTVARKTEALRLHMTTSVLEPDPALAGPAEQSRAAG